MSSSNKKKLTMLLAVTACALCLLAILTTVRSGAGGVPTETERAQATRTVSSPQSAGALAQPIAAPATIAGPGAIEPAGEEVAVASTRTGVVSVVHVSEGDFVQAGQPLLGFENGDEALALTAAQLDAKRARAEFERLERGGHGPEELASAEADALAAMERATLSAQQAKRSRRLLEQGATTSEEAERAEAQVRIDEANAASLAARAKALATPWSLDLKVSRLKVAQAEAAVQQARHTLEERTVRAPAAGTILEVLKRPGELYSPSSGTLLIMGDTRRLRARIAVDARDVASIAIGQPAYVLVDAFPARRFSGRVIELARRMGKPPYVTDDPAARKDTRTMGVLIELDDPAGLIPAQPVTGYIDVGSARRG